MILTTYLTNNLLYASLLPHHHHHHIIQKIKLKERQDELQRAIEGNGGTEIHIGVGGGGGDNSGGGGLVTGTLKSGVDAKVRFDTDMFISLNVYMWFGWGSHVTKGYIVLGCL